MNITFTDRRPLVTNAMVSKAINEVSYFANPMITIMEDHKARIFFNSRTKRNFSIIQSIDIDLRDFSLELSSFQTQIGAKKLSGFCSHGLSLGGTYLEDGQYFVSTMGWINKPPEHWYGTIGKIRMDDEFNLVPQSLTEWFTLDSEDSISLSYPAIYERDGTSRMWYGSTLTWDAGNGEMLHILKEKVSTDSINFVKTGRILNYDLNTAQAFSRPSILEINGRALMAYSYRGGNSHYRIGFVWLDDLTTASHLGGLASFLPSGKSGEAKMVEYPFLFIHNSEIYMLYNGDDFGKTGIGVVTLQFEH